MSAPSRADSVTLVEVGPRDGLQNEPGVIGTTEKLAFIEGLVDAGATHVEVASFVNPRLVPQMADAAEVCAGLVPRPGVRYSALVPNLTGLERAQRAGIRHVAVFGAASETFSRRNLNQGIDGAFAAFGEVVRAATSAGMDVRGYLSTSFGCPFEGAVAPSTVAELSERLLDLGVYEVAISDTIGVAHPMLVDVVLDAVLARVPVDKVALHLHDTWGMALANVLRGVQRGVRTFDASAGGLGGCPFAPGATGNAATEDVVYMLDGMGLRTGIDLARLVHVSAQMEAWIGRPLPSRCYRALRSRVNSVERAAAGRVEKGR